jgi:hypothetical protein
MMTFPIYYGKIKKCSKPPISQLIFRKPQEDSDDFKWIILKLSGEIPALFENCQPQSDAKRISH